MSCIFISYRRTDNAAGYSRSLAQTLRGEFGKDQVFRDIRSIPPGQDFPTFIQDTLASCRVMLVLIGTQWTRVTDDQGNRRLDNAQDWVRREVGAALERDILVIPVLVCGARMPAASELPPDLTGLASRNAFAMSDDDWEHDLEQLIAALRKHLGPDIAGDQSHTVAPTDNLYQALTRAARRFPGSRRPVSTRPGLLRRAASVIVGWLRAAAFIALLVWIGYTQSDAFAAGVDRFFARSADMLAQLLP